MVKKVNVKLKFSLYMPQRCVCKGVEVQFHIFLPLTLDGCEMSFSCTSCFMPRKDLPSTHCIVH
jgi:hypothetical protein